jgi:hypothetical protein
MDPERAVLIEAATEALDRSMQRIRTSMAQETSLTFAEWLNKTMALFIGERLNGPPGVTSRTGDLRRSFYTTVQGTGMDQVGVIGSRAVQAKVLEYGTGYLPGGAIRANHPTPKGGRPMLAIPLPGSPALTKAGVYRLGATPLRQVLPDEYIDWKFFVHRTGERVVLMGQALPGPGEKWKPPVPWFALKYELRYGPKLGLTKTVRKYMKVLTQSLAKAMKGVTGG